MTYFKFNRCTINLCLRPSTNAFDIASPYIMLPIHTTRKDRERNNRKYLLATCAIWVKNSLGQGNRLAGTGSLVKNFFEDEKIHLITSKEVISTDVVNSYFLRFKKLNGSDKRRRELNSIGNKVEFISPGLAIVHVDPDKVSFIRKRTSGLLTYRPFAICVEENEGNSNLYCHFVKRSGNKSFDIISCTAYEISTETENVDQDRKSLGAPIAITKHGEAKIVGVITRDNNMQIYRVLFSQIDRSRVCSAQEARKENTHLADQYTSVQGTSQTAQADIEHGNEPNMSDAKAVKHGKKIGHDNDPEQLAQRMKEDLMNPESGIDSMEEDGFDDNRGQEKDVQQQRKKQPKQRMGRKAKKNYAILDEIHPFAGSVEGGLDFTMVLNDAVPGDVISYEAEFEDCAVVPLKLKNPFTLKGLTPCSRHMGIKKVTLRFITAKGSQIVGSKSFRYDDTEGLAQLVSDKITRLTFLELMADSKDEDTNACTSVEVLRLLIRKAVWIGCQELVEIICSTKAAHVGLNSFKSGILPEHHARGKGHEELADYIQNTRKRLSKEGNTETKNFEWSDIQRVARERYDGKFRDSDSQEGGFADDEQSV